MQNIAKACKLFHTISYRLKWSVSSKSKLNLQDWHHQKKTRDCNFSYGIHQFVFVIIKWSPGFLSVRWPNSAPLIQTYNFFLKSKGKNKSDKCQKEGKGLREIRIWKFYEIRTNFWRRLGVKNNSHYFLNALLCGLKVSFFNVEP